MERVGVVIHPSRQVEDALMAVRGWTEDHGFELVQIQTGEQPQVAPAGAVGACDLIAAIGGDGTVLKALHASARTGTPVLGVACGSLGALAAVPAGELGRALDRFGADDWSQIRLPSLELSYGDGQRECAINDVVLTRQRGNQLMLDLNVDGELYVRLAGDGVVIATALGSSAYTMAARGPLLAPGTPIFVCTPLAMHGGAAPPLVLGGEREVTLEVHPGHGGFGVEVDGFELELDAVRFSIACEDDYATLVAFSDSPGPLTRLRERGLISDSPRVAAHAGTHADRSAAG